MKKLLFLASLFLLLMGFIGNVSAATLSYDRLFDGNGDPTTPYGWATVETFDDGTPGWTISGDYTIRSGALISGESAPPAGDTTNYISVPKVGDDDNVGTATIFGFGATQDYFGLFWGSVDEYNSISFYLGGNLQDTIYGSDVASPANGDQFVPGTNLYVNIFDVSFDEVRMTSTSMAFEADNLAAGAAPVPEPATMLLLGYGIVGLAGFRRKFKK